MKIVYVVMRQEIDWGGGPREPDSVFTDLDEAYYYVSVANQARYESNDQPRIQYWVVKEEVELDPKPLGEIE